MQPSAAFDKFVDGLQIAKGEDAASFAPLDPDSTSGLGGTSAEVFGPEAVLLIGYTQEQFGMFKAMMEDMDAHMFKIYAAGEVEFKSRLCDAFDTAGFKPAPLGTRRAVIMSGMYTSEVMEVIGAYRDSALPPTAFAAAVPNNWEKYLPALLKELFEDDAVAKAQMVQSQSDM
eukprot:jgi/Ulvmu1/6988/UM033_0046.1